MSKTNPNGQFVWHELMTGDPRKARAFYGELFGWTFAEMEMGPIGKYTTFGARGDDLGGIAPLDGGAQPQWMPYVAVENVDAAAKRAPVLGGKVVVAPTEIPNVGRFAIIEDPTGAALAVFQGGA